MVSIRRIPGLVVLLLLFAVAASAQHTNATAITITDCPNPCPASGQPATLYPSPITVSGEVGVVQRVSVTLQRLQPRLPCRRRLPAGLAVGPQDRDHVRLRRGLARRLEHQRHARRLRAAARPVHRDRQYRRPVRHGHLSSGQLRHDRLFPAPAPGRSVHLHAFRIQRRQPRTARGTCTSSTTPTSTAAAISGGWTITFDVRPPPPAAGDILISEFRTRGAGTTPPGSDGSADEFIELYNNTDSAITIIDASRAPTRPRPRVPAGASPGRRAQPKPPSRFSADAHRRPGRSRWHRAAIS